MHASTEISGSLNIDYPGTGDIRYGAGPSAEATVGSLRAHLYPRKRKALRPSISPAGKGTHRDTAEACLIL